MLRVQYALYVFVFRALISNGIIKINLLQIRDGKVRGIKQKGILSQLTTGLCQSVSQSEEEGLAATLTVYISADFSSLPGLCTTYTYITPNTVVTVSASCFILPRTVFCHCRNYRDCQGRRRLP